MRKATLERVLRHHPFAAPIEAVLIVGTIATASCDGQPVVRAPRSNSSPTVERSSQRQPAGVRIAIEPINRYESETMRTVDHGQRLSSPRSVLHVDLLIDMFHTNIEETSASDSLARGGPHLLNVHLADSNRRHPGAAHLDFAAIVESLDAAGYDGFLPGEFLPEPSPNESAQRYLAKMTTFAATSA
jgi:sugar phosphate isomerase/epimerase